MKNAQFISRPVLAKLQAVYNQFQLANPKSSASSFAVALKEFLERFGEERMTSPGEILFQEGDPGENLYWIESGALAILHGKLNNPTLLTFRYSGHVVGEIALLENISRTASVVAVTPTHLRYLTKEKFQEILSRVPDVSMEIMRLLSARVREVKAAEYGDSYYDHLTGALSRQAFDSRLEEEISRADHYHYDFALVFVALDRFREINDHYGHAHGDLVLVEFVRRIVLELRTTDLFFRYGGAEFVLILQGVNHERGPALVERLLDLVRLTPIPGDPPLFLSFSSGIAYFPADGSTPESLVDVAAQRLADVQKSVRKRVTVG